MSNTRTSFASRGLFSVTIRAALLLAVLALAACGGDTAKGPGGVTGWEQGGEFDRHYSITEFDKIKGYFVRTTDVVPLPGMAVGVAVVMRDRADNEPVTVVLGPKEYAGPLMDKLALRDGERINAYGAWARVGDKDVIIGTKIKKTETEFVKVRRTKDGVPYWAMSPEEVARELEGDDD